MRRAARRDGNHAELREGCALVGISWMDIAPLVKGMPDALVGWRGEDRLIEVKDPKASNTDRKLRPDQVEWAGKWQGNKPAKVEAMADILALFGLSTSAAETAE